MLYVTTQGNEVNTVNLQKWVDYFERNIKPRLQKLESYYNGTDDLNKVETELDKYNKRQINNIHVNYAKMIVSNACGYFMGKPVVYQFNNSPIEKDIRELMWRCDEQAENITLAKDASKFGVAYELMALDDDKKVYIKSLSPLNTFFVVGDDIQQKKLFAVTYWKRLTDDNKEIVKGFVYSKDSIFSFNGTDKIYKITEENVNPFKPVLPVFEYKNNDECSGDFESVLDVLSAYSKLISTNFDDVDSVANSILALKNARINKEEAKELKKTRILELIGENADVEYLNKSLDKNYVEYLRKALKEDIYSVTKVPDLTDEKFAGNQSGVALSYKLIGFENLRQVKQNYFEKALYQRLKCFANYKNLSDVEKEIDEETIVITFKVNLPSNLDKDMTYAKLYSDGVLSLDTTLSLMECVDNPDEELEKIQKEKPSIEDLNAEEGNTETA